MRLPFGYIDDRISLSHIISSLSHGDMKIVSGVISHVTGHI